MIEKIGNFQFLVSSSKPGQEPYLVDMHELNGNGVCTCWDFTSRRRAAYDLNPEIVNYRPPNSRQKDLPPPTRCKHIDQVVFFLGEMVVQESLRGSLNP